MPHRGSCASTCSDLLILGISRPQIVASVTVRFSGRSSQRPQSRLARRLSGSAWRPPRDWTVRHRRSGRWPLTSLPTDSTGKTVACSRRSTRSLPPQILPCFQLLARTCKRPHRMSRGFACSATQSAAQCRQYPTTKLLVSLAFKPRLMRRPRRRNLPSSDRSWPSSQVSANFASRPAARPSQTGKPMGKRRFSAISTYSRQIPAFCRVWCHPTFGLFHRRFGQKSLYRLSRPLHYI